MSHLLRLSLVCLFCITSSSHGQELKVFFGLMHGHTSFSDGSGEPDEAFEMAKEAGLDFMAITEHNHNEAAGDDGVFLTPQLYGRLIQSARAHTKADEFLAIWGQEVSTISAGNHANIFFADQICNMPHGDFKFLYEQFLPAHPEIPFIQFNHPDARADMRSTTPANKRQNDYGLDDYGKDFDRLVRAAGPHVALIELVIGPAFATSDEKLHQNGKHEKDYLFYLNKGFQLAPSVGQDNHKKTWGVATHARMGVWATRLTPEAFINAIKERRCYASEDENAVVRFTVNGKMMGSIANPSPGEPAVIQVSVRDEDEPAAEHRVRLFYDDELGGDEAKVVEDQTLEAGESEIEFLHTPEPGGYYFAKITQRSDHSDDMWTAPVWIAGQDTQRNLLVAANTDDPQKEEINWSEATDYVGQDVIVHGQVIRSFKLQDKVVFFNFDRDYENTLTLIVLRSDFEAFGGEDAVVDLQDRLTNKFVRVQGEISLFRDERVQMRLTSPSQILGVTDSEIESEE